MARTRSLGSRSPTATPQSIRRGRSAVRRRDRRRGRLGDESRSTEPSPGSHPGRAEADGDPITVGANPKGIAVGDDAVWVANTDDGTVSRIDPEAVEADAETITVGTEPRGVVAAFGSVWVTNGTDNSVSRIDPEDREVIETIPVGEGPEGITAGADSIWVANGDADTVTRISP